MRIAVDVFGLLPAPQVRPINSRFPDELTRLIRELEDLLDEAKTTAASISTADKSKEAAPGGS
jgi:hypothetical protein